MPEDIKIEVIASPVHLGEGPHWESESQSLIYVDIFAGDLHRIFMDSGRHQTLHIEGDGALPTVSFVVPIEDHKHHYAVGFGHCIGYVTWFPEDPDKLTTKVNIISAIDEPAPGMRFNDGKCDPKGRIWAGTMGPEADHIVEPHMGALYCLNNDKAVKAHIEKIGISNGLAWSIDHNTFYYIDSLSFTVDAFDYDIETGNIGNKRIIFDYKKEGFEDDVPDGMTIDEKGNLWVASFSGFKILNIDPNSGKVLRKIDMPCQHITSVCFGGNDYSVLYVTTANKGLTEEQKGSTPAGSTFKITGLGVKGLPGSKFVVEGMLP